jgi:hypothetical protein
VEVGSAGVGNSGLSQSQATASAAAGTGAQATGAAHLSPVEQGNQLRAADEKAGRLQPGQTAPQPKAQACEFTNQAGMCVYTRDAQGKLQVTPEYQKQICKNYNALQDGAAKTNDGLTAIGVIAAKKGGTAGGIVGALSTFGTFVSSLTTGAGFRPFGITVIPKSPPPPGCN